MPLTVLIRLLGAAAEATRGPSKNAPPRVEGRSDEDIIAMLESRLARGN